MAELFRKSALDTMATPEQLDKQVKIMRPPMWMAGLILVTGVVTLILWSFTYHITTGTSMNGVIFTNNNVVQIKAQRASVITDVLVTEGEHVGIGDIIAVISNDEMLTRISDMRTELERSGDTDGRRLAEEQLQAMIDEYIALTVIKSTCSGYIQGIRTSGSAIDAGDSIVSIMPDSGYNEVVAYVPLQTAQNLRLGMAAQVSPFYAPREEYGYMMGAVTQISDTPVSEESVLSKMGTLSYVENILPEASCVEVRIKLYLNPDSANAYQWSNKKGEALSVELGTQCSIMAVNNEFRPVELLLG